MKRRFASVLAALLAVCVFLFAYGCVGGPEQAAESGRQYAELVSDGLEENVFAERYSMEHLHDGAGNRYTLLKIFGENDALDSSWLLLPEGITSVTGLPAGTQTLTWEERQNILVSSASTMALINAMDSLDRVPMTTSDTTWRIPAIQEAIDAGQVCEVGKYSAPDYERILGIGSETGVKLAVFSTMIDSVPDVERQLTQTCGLSVMRDQSSGESHPLGRTEWIKIYGEIFDRRAAADAVFDAQVTALEQTVQKIGDIADADKKTVVIFYTTASRDTFYVRNAADYVTELVNLAGGKQVCEIGAGKSGNTKMTQEEFIQVCAQADYVLYNWTSGASGVSDETLQGLMDARLGDWFRDFKAYQEGNVWRTSNDFYQKMDKMGEMVADIYSMLYEDTISDSLTYVNRLK